MAKITFYNDFTRVWNVDGSLLGAVARLINIYKEKQAILHDLLPAFFTLATAQPKIN